MSHAGRANRARKHRYHAEAIRQNERLTVQSEVGLTAVGNIQSYGNRMTGYRPAEVDATYPILQEARYSTDRDADRGRGRNHGSAHAKCKRINIWIIGLKGHVSAESACSRSVELKFQDG